MNWPFKFSWLLPIILASCLAIAGADGATSIPLPPVAISIALSGVMLGSVVLFAAKPAFWIAAVLFSTFAVFLGNADGAELPIPANSMPYMVGFVSSMGLLHLVGIAIWQLSLGRGLRRYR